MTARKSAQRSSKSPTKAVKSATDKRVQKPKPAVTRAAFAKNDRIEKKTVSVKNDKIVKKTVSAKGEVVETVQRATASDKAVGKTQKKASAPKKAAKKAEASTKTTKTKKTAAGSASNEPKGQSANAIKAKIKSSKDNKSDSSVKRKGKENDKAVSSSSSSRRASTKKAETTPRASTKSRAKALKPAADDEKKKAEDSSQEKVKRKRAKKAYEHAYEDPDWQGNEDDTGSVASGVMEEDFCFECGISTLAQKDDWNNVVLCDRCDAEYHLHCAGLDRVPRRAFICHRCTEEERAFHNVSFDVGSQFKLPRKKKTENKVVYSPSRPLQMAWPECESKGLMVVSRVFSYEVMRVLTHGVVEHHTKSGRIVDVWQGAVREVPQRLSSHACHNVVDRQGRFDLKLPDFLVEKLELPKLLEPILSRLRTIMGTPTPQIRTHNVVFAPVGSSAQEWHADDSMKKHKIHRYFTVLIQLNPLDTDSGGTEVWEAKTKTSDLIRCRPGDALVFNGSLLHRGQANTGSTHRFFYYASFACGNDMNVGMM